VGQWVSGLVNQANDRADPILRVPKVHNWPMPEPLTLRGRHVHLLPMEIGHADDLLRAATEERSTFAFVAVPHDRPMLTAYMERSFAARDLGVEYPFVTVSVDQDQIVGSTRYYELQPWDWTPTGPAGAHQQRRGRPDVVNIGYTWLAPSAQRSPVNTESKLLMMSHAFDVWEARAVRIQTDVRNQRSRRAIERLGCHLDGVLRAHRPAADGSVRDSATYSMLADEWPEHRDRLRVRLASG
jgi:N-acetyltransferase